MARSLSCSMLTPLISVAHGQQGPSCYVLVTNCPHCTSPYFWRRPAPPPIIQFVLPVLRHAGWHFRAGYSDFRRTPFGRRHEAFAVQVRPSYRRQPRTTRRSAVLAPRPKWAIASDTVPCVLFLTLGNKQVRRTGVCRSALSLSASFIVYVSCDNCHGVSLFPLFLPPRILP